MNLHVFDRLRGHPDDASRRGELVIRTVPILLLPVVVALATGVLLGLLGNMPPRPAHISGVEPLMPLVPIVVMITFSSAVILLVRIGRPTLSALIMISVWTLIMTLGALGSGIWSFIPALLIIPICAAGLLIDGVASISLAALATILVSSLGYMESQGWYTRPWPAMPFAQEPLALYAVSFWIAVFWTVAALTSLLAGNLKRALHEARAHAAALDALRSQLEARVAEQTAELVQRTARAEALYDVSRALTNTLDLQHVLGLIGEQAARLLDFDAALVLLAHTDDQRFTQVSAYNVPAYSAAISAADQQQFVQVLGSGVPTVVALHEFGGDQQTSALVLPLCYDVRPIGVLVLLQARRPAERNVDDLAVAASFASHAAVAITNAQLLEQAREAAMLEERTRLARDIHDTLAQGLTGIIVLLGAISRALRAAPDEAERDLDLAQRMAREALAEARRSVWNMRAGALARGDLGDALRSLVAHPLKPGIQAQFEQTGTPWPMATGVESALLRITQEALVNVAKHAAATQVSVQLVYTSQSVTLHIRDNGTGFKQSMLDQHASAPSPWQGFGLLGMRERLAILGGTLDLRNNDGAEIVAAVPYAAALRSEASLGLTAWALDTRSVPG